MSVLQCVTCTNNLIVPCTIEFHVRFAVYCSVLQHVAVRWSALQCLTYRNDLIVLFIIELHARVAVCCSVLQYVTYRDDLIVPCIIEFHVSVAVCCSVLQCVAVCHVQEWSQCTLHHRIPCPWRALHIRTAPKILKGQRHSRLKMWICSKLSLENFSWDSGDIYSAPTIVHTHTHTHTRHIEPTFLRKEDVCCNVLQRFCFLGLKRVRCMCRALWRTTYANMFWKVGRLFKSRLDTKSFR